MGIEMTLQVLIVQFGSNAFKVVNNGLTGSQWAICIALGAVTFPVSVLCKLLQIDDCIKNMIIKCCSCRSNKVDDEKKYEEPKSYLELNEYNNKVVAEHREDVIIQSIKNENDPASLKNQGKSSSNKIRSLRNSQKSQPQEKSLRVNKNHY
jgi:hypothetical protein